MPPRRHRDLRRHHTLRPAFVAAVVLGQLGVGLVDVAAGRWGVVEAVLGKRYMVVLDGETEAQPFGLKKVKRLGKPVKKAASELKAPVVDMRGFAEECRQEVADAVRRFAPGAAPDAALRDQRPPTRLRIPDANVPTYPENNPTEIRDGEPDKVVFRGVVISPDPAVTIVLPRSRAQPKPRKPSRSAAYLQHVREHNCCNCGAPGPSDPDHVGSRGVGQKCSDYLVIPLCRTCHRYRTDKNVLPDSPTINGVTYECTRDATENRILRTQVQMLREWAEKLDKETP